MAVRTPMTTRVLALVAPTKTWWGYALIQTDSWYNTGHHQEIGHPPVSLTPLARPRGRSANNRERIERSEARGLVDKIVTISSPIL